MIIALALSLPDFNSIKVRLKLSLDLNTISQIIYFNSIKVRLKHDNHHGKNRTYRNFNSIKVRLKLLSLFIVVYLEPYN